MRIGLFMTDGIGDLICMLGVVRTLRRRWPDAFMAGVLRGAEEATLFSGEARLDETIRYSPSEGNTPTRVLHLIHALRRLRLDVFFVTTDIDRYKAPLLAYATGAPIRVGEVASPMARLLYTHRVAADHGQHKVHSNAAIVRTLVAGEIAEPRIDILPHEVRFASALLSSHGVAHDDVLLAVHAGSSSALEHKRWPPDSYVTVLDRLIDAGIRPVLFGAGTNEVAVAQQIRGALRTPGRAVLLAGTTTLRQTAAVLYCCHAALGADSGVMHIAAAVGTPTVSLFGPTDERRTAPFHAQRVVTAPIACRPCFDRLPHGCGHPVCMSSLSVDSVTAAVKDVLTAEANHALMELAQ